MKRIVSLVLVLVLLLSVLPGAAADGAAVEDGVYLTYENGVLSDSAYQANEETYVVPFVPGTTLEVYYFGAKLQERSGPFTTEALTEADNDGNLIQKISLDYAAEFRLNWVRAEGEGRNFMLLLVPENVTEGVYVNENRTAPVDGVYQVGYREDFYPALWYYTKASVDSAEMTMIGGNAGLEWEGPYSCGEGKGNVWRLLRDPEWVQGGQTMATGADITVTMEDGTTEVLNVSYFEQKEQGLYLDQNLTQMLEPVKWSEQGPWGYTLLYTPEESLTFYYYFPEAGRQVEGYGLSVETMPYLNGTLAALTMNTDRTGIFEADFSFGNGGFPVRFIPSGASVTRNLINVEIPRLYQFGIMLDGGSVAASDVTIVSVPEDMGEFRAVRDDDPVSAEYGRFLWDTANAEPNRTGEVVIQIGSETYRLPISTGDRVQRSAAFPLTEDWTRDWVNESNICVTPFELDGETYYMSASFAGNSFPTSINSMQPVIYDEAEIYDISFSIVFWSDMGEGNYQKITDPALLEKIKAAFNGSLTLEFYGQKDRVLAEEYPAMTRSSNWLCPIEVHLNLKNHGDWVLKASGTIGEKTVESICHYQWAPKEGRVWMPDPEADTDVWTQIQSFVTNYEPEENVMQIVQIPEGMFAGTLVIPDKRIQGNMGLSIVGVPGKTVILGGIKTEGASRINVEGIAFHGANCGCEGHEFPENTPNKAIYGEAVADVTGCTFIGYDVAARIDHTVDCTFINNNVAILFDNYLLGNGQILYNRFVGNKTALDFEKLDSDLPTTFFRIQENKFVDNKWDVRNKLKRTLYLPGNFFGETVGEDVVARPCNAQVKKGSVVASLMDETMEEDNLEYAEQVHAYPRYADTDFNEWAKESEAVVSVAQTAEFRIPQDNLGGSAITVMDAEEELATLVFPDSGSAVSLFSEGGTFDATVSVEENEDGSMTFTMNDPLGMNPMVRIPAARGGVTVTDPKGEALAVTEENGYLCFTATTGGSYTINSTTAAKLDASGTLRVELEITEELEEKGVEQAALAIYNQAGQLVALALHDDLDKPLEFASDKYDLTQCDIKVMLLSDDSAPLCGAAFLKAARAE